MLKALAEFGVQMSLVLILSAVAENVVARITLIPDGVKIETLGTVAILRIVMQASEAAAETVVLRLADDRGERHS